MSSNWMTTRRSVRKFLPDPVPRAEVEAVLAAAVTAPSAMNKQPWRFLVVGDRDLLLRAAAAVREEVARLAERVDARVREDFRSHARGYDLFEAAPVVIVPLWRPVGLLREMLGTSAFPEEIEEHTRLSEENGLVSTTLAMGQLILAAHGRGLGTVVLTGPLLARRRLHEVFKVSPSWRILALVPLGYPAEEPAATPRKPIGVVTRWFPKEDE